MFRSRPAVVVAGSLVATLAGALAAGPALAATPRTERARPVLAVVSLAGTKAVSVPGVVVLEVLPHVHAELVRGAPAGLSLLARAPGVLGVAGNARIQISGPAAPAAPAGPPAPGPAGPPVPGPAAQSTGSVFADHGLGGGAGTPQAGAGVDVAVLDTGLTDTPALNRASGRVTDGVDVSGLLTGEPAQTSGVFTDGYGHGTFLSSLIAGGAVPGSNGQALGVAPGARIVVVKVADSQGDTSLVQVLAGLDWVAAHARAIRVVTIALAQVRPTAPDYGADPLTAGIEQVANAGVLPVVAVGNVPGQVGDPGDDPLALTVGAADTSSGPPAVAGFSGYGNVDGVAKPDLVASGVHVLGELPPDSTVAQDNPQAAQPDGLFRGSGSSMATAIASGVAAIFFSAHPDATVLQAKASLRAATAPLPPGQPGAGAGLLKAGGPELSGPAVSTWANEQGFDPAEWSANAWLGDAWASTLAGDWSGPAWSASTWSASTWSASTWSASTWSASTWSASTWSASTWSASTWSASTWSASTWSASTWSASTWSDEAWG